MIRGTTPSLEFSLPFDTSTLATAWVTLMQLGEVVIDKELNDCVVDTRKLSVVLTQEETLQLKADDMVEIQVRVRTNEGEALASEIIRVKARRILKDGVI